MIIIMLKHTDMDTRDRNKTFNLDSVHSYLTEYSQQLFSALNAMDKENLQRAGLELQVARDLNRRIFVAGNGGSAAISDHLTCDFMKGCYHGNTLQTISLVSNTALLTAIGNDIGYDDIFRYQLRLHAAKPGEVLILISSSGNSFNIIEAANEAKTRGMTVIGLCGFDGGNLKHMADIPLHVNVNNYGIVEDAHQTIMHVLAQHNYLSYKASLPF